MKMFKFTQTIRVAYFFLKMWHSSATSDLLRRNA